MVSDDGKVSSPLLPRTVPRTKWFYARLVFILLVIQFGFGGYSLVLKVAQAKAVNPLVFSLLRDGITGPLLLVAALLVEGPQPIRLWHIPYFAVLGLLLFGNQFFFVLGLYYTNSANASIFQPTIPVFTCLFAIVLRLEPLERSMWFLLKLVGILCSTGGACLMIVSSLIGGGSSMGESSPLVGCLFLLVNCSCTALFVLGQKRWLSGHYPSVTLTAYIYLFAALSMALCSLYYVVTDRGAFTDLTVSVLIPLCYAVFISSGLCYVLITLANKMTSSTVVTAFWPVQTGFVLVMSFFVFHAEFGWQGLLGCFLIVAGLFFVTTASYKSEQRQQQAAEVAAAALFSPAVLPLAEPMRVNS